MEDCPELVGGRKVIMFTKLDKPHTFTGNCKNYIGAERFKRPINGLAICKIKRENGFYLFGCNDKWESLTDT